MSKIKSTVVGPIALQKGASIALTYPRIDISEDVENFEAWVVGIGAGPSDTETFSYAGQIEDTTFRYVADNEISEARLAKIKEDGSKLAISVEVLEL